MSPFLVCIVLVLTPLVECSIQLRSEAIDRLKLVGESGIVADEAEELNTGNFTKELVVGDTLELQRAKPICKSVLGGKCRPSNVACRYGEQESPYGNPYCSKWKRCCYPGCVGGVLIADQCLTISTEKLSWNDAKESCSKQNGRLAMLNDPQAFKDHIHNIYNNQQFWLGASDIQNEGTWIWVNGQPLGGKFPWHYGEPNAAFVDEDCLVLWGDALSDAPCPRQYRYVCEQVPVPVPGSGCDAPWFRIGSQCFRLEGSDYNNLDWNGARNFCKHLGGDLAQPIDIRALRDYLYNIHHTFYWLGWTVNNWDGQGKDSCLTIQPASTHNNLFAKDCHTTQYMKLVCEKQHTH